MVRAALALLLLGLGVYCAQAAGVQDSDSSRRALQQDLFDDAPAEQDVSAYLAALAAAAGVRVEDLQFNESLDEKAPPVQLPQQPTPNLLRLISRMSHARGNPAYTGPGQPGPNFPGFGVSRPGSFSAVDSAAAFGAATGGFGPPGSNQPYQLPERFRHYLDADPLQLPNLPEPQQQQQQPGYTPESGQMSSQQQQQQQPGVNTPEISSLITKLSGRGRKFGTSPGGVSHEMLHASIPRLESAPIGPPSLDATTQQQLAQQPGLLTVGTRVEGGNYGEDAATEQLLAELVGLDPVTAKQQFQSLLNKVGGRSASVSEVTARKPYIPREKAAPLAPGGSDLADSSDSASAAGALQQLGDKQQQQELMDGRDGHSAYGRIVTDNVVLADSLEIDRDAGKAAADANAALAAQPVKVDILQVDPTTFAALEQETPQTFDEIQDEAATVAAAAAAAGTSSSNRSKQQSVLQQQDSTHSDNEVIAPAGLASHLMPDADELASGSNRSNKKGLPAGAATGIALGAFGAVLLGAGVLLFVQARKMDQDTESGYTPTAQAEDLELANQKQPAVCISPAVSMGGAAISSGGAAADVARPDRRFTLNGGVEAAAGSFGEASSGSATGWLRALTGRAASGSAAAAAPSRAASAATFRLTAEGMVAAPVTRPPAAAGDIRRFTLTSE